MPILTQDIKLLKSSVMADTSDGNQTVNTTLNSSDEPALLDPLTRAKKVS